MVAVLYAQDLAESCLWGGFPLVSHPVQFNILCDFTNEMLEGELPDEELSWFLVVMNFTEQQFWGENDEASSHHKWWQSSMQMI